MHFPLITLKSSSAAFRRPLIDFSLLATPARHLRYFSSPFIRFRNIIIQFNMHFGRLEFRSNSPAALFVIIIHRVHHHSQSS